VNLSQEEHTKNGNMDYFIGDEDDFAKLVDKVNAEEKQPM
jgi:hypothetical protein